MLYKKENDRMLCYLTSMGFKEQECSSEDTWYVIKAMHEWGLTVSFSYNRRQETVIMTAYFTPAGYPNTLHLMRKFSFHDFAYMSEDADVARRIFVESHKEISSALSTITLKYMALNDYSIGSEGEIQDFSYYDL